MQENTGGVGQVSHLFKSDFLTILCWIIMILGFLHTCIWLLRPDERCTPSHRVSIHTDAMRRVHPSIEYIINIIIINLLILLNTPVPDPNPERPRAEPDPSKSGPGGGPGPGRVPIFLPDPDPNRTLARNRSNEAMNRKNQTNELEETVKW